MNRIMTLVWVRSSPNSKASTKNLQKHAKLNPSATKLRKVSLLETTAQFVWNFGRFELSWKSILILVSQQISVNNSSPCWVSRSIYCFMSCRANVNDIWNSFQAIPTLFSDGYKLKIKLWDIFEDITSSWRTLRTCYNKTWPIFVTLDCCDSTNSWKHYHRPYKHSIS